MTNTCSLPSNDRTHDRTRMRVLGLLKSHHSNTAGSIANTLSISIPAVRKHLDNLADAGFISAELQKPSGRGRPQLVYSLTSHGEEQFPKTYASLCVEILHHVEKLFGEDALLQVIDARRLELAAQWKAHLQGNLRERCYKLAELLSAAGYDARITEEDSILYLEQGNCPNLEVAHHFGSLCNSELNLYRELLGTQVFRETRIACGAPSCRYRIMLEK